MTFSFWSLDFIYYPVSGIMWIWHKVFGGLFGALGVDNPQANPWTWVLSVMFLVFTLRAIMFKPFMKQMDASLKMQAIQPEMKRIREKYKDDRQRLSEEMMKLNKEAGVNPLASCLPALLQAPAFIGLFHVLRNFIYAFDPSKVKPEMASDTINNYFFPPSDVLSFHDAVLFDGASLSAHLTMPVQELAALNSDRQTMLWVGIPLMILAAVATHLSSRKSVYRQKQMGTTATGGQAEIMQKLMLYGFPLGVLFIGAFYPLALLFYWLANNFWTFGQLAVAHKLQDRKLAAQAKVVEAEKESTGFSKPKPGAKPRPANGPGAANGPRPGAKPSPGAKPAPGSKPVPGAKPSPGAKPAPGSKPQRGSISPTPKPDTSPPDQPGKGKGAGGKGSPGKKPKGR